MKKILTILFCSLLTGTGWSQLKIGIKGGINFANITSTAGFNSNNRTGTMIGIYIAPKPKKILGFRSEIMLSRQGYNYKTNTSGSTVSLDYLLLPQLITLNIGKKINIHAGPQIAILLNAESDTIQNNGGLISYFKKFDYAAAGGMEISPISGFFIGARVNISLQKANEDPPLGGSWPAEVPRLDAKNNVVQLYAGWRF